MTSEDDEYVLLSSENESFFYTTHGNDTYGMYEFYAVPQLVFISVVCIFIIVGNSCVLAAIRLSENGRKSRMNFFIMHLAIADLLVGVMVVITDLASKITVEWHAGNVMCKLSQYTQTAVTYSSTYMLVSLSIDRYDAVARPMNFSRSGLQGRFLVLVSWVVSLVFASPAFYLYSETVREGRKQCWMDFPEFWHWQLFFTAVFVVTFLLPAIIIATCYIAIIYIIWSKGRFHEPRSVSRGHHTGGSSAIHPRLIINESRHDTGRGIIPQAKIRTIKMTLIIVIVFIMCWSPFFLYNLLDVYNIIAPNNPVSTLIQSAAPLNSAANPIIYGIFSTRICKNLRRIPLPSCLRAAACRCKEPHCARRGYRARHHHNYLPSQTTDPTLTTLDVNRRIADFKLSGIKTAIRAGRRQKGLSEKDLNILNEAAVKLGKEQLTKRSNNFKSKGRNKRSENSGGLDYELAPLARRAKLSGKFASEGSEESPPSSETIVHPVRKESKSRIETDLRNGSIQRSYDALVDIDGDVPGPSAEVNGLSSKDDQHSFKIAQENSRCAIPDETRSSDDHVAFISETASGDESSSCKVSSSKYSEGDIMEQIIRDCEELDFARSDVFADSELSLADDASSVIGGGHVQHGKCSEYDAVMSLDTNEQIFLESEDSEAFLPSRAQEGLTDRSLAHRRPSGVPTVRRRLTSEESNLLTKATCKWLMNEVKASESSVMS